MARDKPEKRWSRVDWNLGSFASFGVDDPAEPRQSSAGSGSGSRSGDAGGKPSRYDPSSVARIGDIRDLVVAEDDDDSTVSPDAAAGVSGGGWARGAALALALAAGAVAGGVGGVTLGDRRVAARVAARAADQQRLLEVAERVVLACGQTADAEDGDGGECAELCDGNMCCVEGDGTCDGGAAGECAVYAGCQALLVADELAEATALP